MKRLMTLTAALTMTAGAWTLAAGQDRTSANAQARPEQKPEAKASPAIAGQWNLAVETQAGSQTSVLDLKMDGAKVTGTLTSQLGTAEIAGSFGDGKLTFGLPFSTPSGNVQLTFTGVLAADGTLAGTMDFGGQGMQIPWRAARVKTVEEAAPKPADPPKPASIAGKWTMSMEMTIGAATPALVFKQDGEKITGTYTGRYGTYELKGTIKDRALAFSLQMDTDGGATTMSFTGTVGADGVSIKGDGSIEGLGDITWTAKKEKDGGS